jgi:hypothetical protein
MQDDEVEADDEPPAVYVEGLQEDPPSLATLIIRRPGVLEGGDTLLSVGDYANLPGEDESFAPLTDAELVQLVPSENAPGLVDVLATDEQIIPESSLSNCLTALEMIQVTLAANGAFSAEIEDKLADVVDEVSFVLRNTAKQTNITQYCVMYAGQRTLHPPCRACRHSSHLLTPLASPPPLYGGFSAICRVPTAIALCNPGRRRRAACRAAVRSAAVHLLRQVSHSRSDTAQPWEHCTARVPEHTPLCQRLPAPAASLANVAHAAAALDIAQAMPALA